MIRDTGSDSTRTSRAHGRALTDGSRIQGRSLLSFGDFELDLETGELRKDGSVIVLASQPCKILGLLASQPCKLVTREEIRDHVWAHGTYVDFQQGINFAINKIRIALQDSAESPRYIETLPRRGYRFVAPVQVLPRREKFPQLKSTDRSSASEKRVVVVISRLSSRFEQRRRRRRWLRIKLKSKHRLRIDIRS